MDPPPAPDRPSLDPPPADAEVTWLGPVIRTETSLRVGTGPGDDGSSLPGLWLVFFSLNLIVPLILGVGTCGPLGVLGLIAAVGFSGAFGYQYLKAYPAIQGAALTGSIVVALSQFLPILQIGAGLVGLTVAGMMETGGARFGPGRLGLIGGFYATFLTGQILILASLLIGGAFHLIGRVFGMIIRVPSAPPSGGLATVRFLEPAEPAGLDARDG